MVWTATQPGRSHVEKRMLLLPQQHLHIPNGVTQLLITFTGPVGGCCVVWYTEDWTVHQCGQNLQIRWQSYNTHTTEPARGQTQANDYLKMLTTYSPTKHHHYSSIIHSVNTPVMCQHHTTPPYWSSWWRWDHAVSQLISQMIKKKRKNTPHHTRTECLHWRGKRINYTTLPYTTLRSATLHYTTPHYRNTLLYTWDNKLWHFHDY